MLLLKGDFLLTGIYKYKVWFILYSPLEPIAENYRTVVCPFIDVIDFDNFAYRAQDEGARGAFDWEFFYKRLPLLPEDLKYPARPFRSDSHYRI